MSAHNLFSTPLWVDSLGLDQQILLDDINNFVSSNKSVHRSNEGGYQGQDYNNKQFIQAVSNVIPYKRGKQFSEYKIYSWVNINNKTNYNSRHSHFNTNVFLSGVYYVKVPENSGNLKLYDPRGHWVTQMFDYIHFRDGISFETIIPQEDMIILFPSWLEHEVEPNESDEERISIAFNIFIK